MAWLLSNAYELTEVLRAVQRHFERGGDVGASVAIIMALAAIVLIVRLLTRRDRSVQAGGERADPQRLFQDMLASLQLTPQQRKSLMAMSRESGLAHPSVLLLSRTVFDRHLKTWQKRCERTPPTEGMSIHDEPLVAVRAVLFPTK